LQDSNALLGSGAYGTVYRRCLRGGTQVAIKVLNADSQQGQREFERELAILGGLHHDHLLPLLGSCSERHAWCTH
jgi:serine/threonine protein kinase